MWQQSAASIQPVSSESAEQKGSCYPKGFSWTRPQEADFSHKVDSLQKAAPSPKTVPECASYLDHDFALKPLSHSENVRTHKRALAVVHSDREM